MRNPTESKKRFLRRTACAPAPDPYRSSSKPQLGAAEIQLLICAPVRSLPAPLLLKPHAPKCSAGCHFAAAMAQLPAAPVSPCDTSHAAAFRKSNKGCRARALPPEARCRADTLGTVILNA